MNILGRLLGRKVQEQKRTTAHYIFVCKYNDATNANNTGDAMDAAYKDIKRIIRGEIVNKPEMHLGPKNEDAILNLSILLPLGENPVPFQKEAEGILAKHGFKKGELQH